MYPYIIVFFLLLWSDYISKKYVNFICFFIIFIFLGIRYEVGRDLLWFYPMAQEREIINFSLFDTLKNTDISVWKGKYYIFRYLGFEFLDKVLFKIVWFIGEPQLITLIYSYLGLIFIKQGLSKIKKEYVKYSWIFFFCFSEFFLLYCNLIRQSVAISITFYSYKFVEKREPIKFLICILLAVGFHTSAIFMLPLYLFNYIKKINKKFLIVIYILSFFGKEIVLEIMKLGWLPQKYIAYVSRFFPIGMKTYYLILVMGILLLIFLNQIDKEKRILVLIVFAGCCLNLLFKGTGYLMIRTRVYYLIFILYLIPDLLKITKKYFKTKYVYTFVCFLLLVLTLLNDKNGGEKRQYTPYKTFLSRSDKETR